MESLHPYQQIPGNILHEDSDHFNKSKIFH